VHETAALKMTQVAAVDDHGGDLLRAPLVHGLAQPVVDGALAAVLTKLAAMFEPGIVRVEKIQIQIQIQNILEYGVRRRSPATGPVVRPVVRSASRSVDLAQYGRGLPPMRPAEGRAASRSAWPSTQGGRCPRAPCGPVAPLLNLLRAGPAVCVENAPELR
jgi:hypothetical protein